MEKILKLKIKNKFDRKKLAEGRNYGIGFAFLTPTRANSKKVLKTMNAFSACKDYLNDLVFVERYNTPLKKIHGFEHTYTGAFKEKDFVLLGVTVLPYNNSNTWKKLKEASLKLKNNLPFLLISINKLEEYLNLPTRTTLYGTTEKEYVLHIPSIWVTRGWLISLLTLWIRCFFNVTAYTTSQSFSNMVKLQENYIFIHADNYMYKHIEAFIKEKDFKSLLKKNLPNKSNTSSVVHNLGIGTFLNLIKKNEKKRIVAIIS